MLIEADLWLTNTGTMGKETNEQPQVLVDQQRVERTGDTCPICYGLNVCIPPKCIC